MDTILHTPISQHVIHIRSSETTLLDDNLNTHFNFTLREAIPIGIHHEAHIIVSSAEIPYSFYNISAALKNNTIVWDTTNTITLTDQNYNINSLITKINADGAFPFTASFSRDTMKITLTSTDAGSSHTINFGDSLARKLMGFDSGDKVVTALSSVSSDNVVNLATVHSILVRSNLSTANVQSTANGHSTILQKLSIDVNGFNLIYLNQDDFRTAAIVKGNVIDKIEMKLTDQNNNILDLNKCEFELSLLVQIFESVRHDRVHQLLERAAQVAQPIPKPIQQAQQQYQQYQPFNPLRNRGQNFYRTPAPKQLMVGASPLSYGASNVSPYGIIQPITRVKDIDSTHPIKGKSDIEHTAETTILNTLIDLMKK